MSQPEEKLVKIVDESTHTRGASVTQLGDFGALVVRAIDASPTSSVGSNAAYTFSSEDTEVSSQVTMTKTVGSDAYTRTFSFNVGGDVLSITAWE